MMLLDLHLLANIIESFSMTTGVPTVLIDYRGNILLTSQGFSPPVFSFADLNTTVKYLQGDARIDVTSPDRYYTLFTENQFLYNLVPLNLETSGSAILVAGPLRFHPPTDLQLITLLRSKHIPLRNKSEIARQIARLPLVSMSRLEHLGRVLCSLCHAYISEGVDLSPDAGGYVDETTTLDADTSTITFTLVEEDIHGSFALSQQIKKLVLSGDVAGIRAMKNQSPPVPLDRLIEEDTLRSVRYNLISAVAAITGMIFDHNLPHEQLLMTGDKYIRLADQAKSIPEMINLMYQSMEDFARIVKRYSAQQYSKPVRQVLEYIQSNLAQKITLQKLAKLTELSPSYLSRLIKKETGLPPVDLINRQRMEEGKYLLINTDYSILQISEMVGFSYQNHFSLRFKKYTGMSPSAFRKKGGRSNG